MYIILTKKKYLISIAVRVTDLYQVPFIKHLLQIPFFFNADKNSTQ